MEVCKWSGSGSDHFISDVPCTEVLRSLDVTSSNKKLLKMEPVIKLEKTEYERKKSLTGSKALSNIIIKHLGLQINIL